MTATTARSRHRRGRGFEILAVLMLGLATLGSAWCGYQASRWNGQEGRLARQASDELVEASRLFGLAVQTASYDSTVVAQFAQAYASGNEALQRFYREVLVRPGFRPTIDEWVAQADAGQAPQNLLEDEQYVGGLATPYQEAREAAAATSEESVDAGENADGFILITVLFASALFFAGVTTSFRFRPVQALLLLSSGAIVTYAATRLSDLPVA